MSDLILRLFIGFCLVNIATPVFSKEKTDSLDIKIGQMIMIGINDRTSLQASDPIISELKTGKIGGIVLFEKNISKQSPIDSLKLLVKSFQSNAPIPLFVSIDEEGGKVHRLKEKYGFPAMPSASYLGNLDNDDSTLFYNRRLAATLKDLGININYAPTLDLAVNPENTVIVKNGRSFGNSYERVVKHAVLCVQAHHEQGVGVVLKHFPGHGSSAGDSHLGMVDVTTTWSLGELLPYEKLLKTTECDGVMIGHLVNSRWDASMLPATLSKPSVDMLRNLLAYNGVLFSDDMQMQAISDNYGFGNAIMMAINAGVDVLVFANTLPAKEKLVTASQVHVVIKKLVKKKKISKSRIDEAYTRIINLKSKRT